jgi:hypothetical protein
MPASTQAFERELRAAWATGRRIAVTFTATPHRRMRAQGRVRHVAATGQFALVGRTHVPITAVFRIEDAPPISASARNVISPLQPPIDGQLRLA